MALFECFSSVTNRPEDVGEATVLGKMVRRITVYDLFDSSRV
jgi:hypothetical protein